MNRFNIRRISVIAMFSAVSFLCVLAGRVVPNIAGFLSYDPKDALIVIAGFTLGPLAALVITVLVSVIEMLSVSNTGIYGLIMNVFSTCAFALPAAFIYKYKRNLKGAILGLASGMFSMSACMVLWNYIITPFYMGVDRSVVAGMLFSVFLPFNLIKAGLNLGLALLIYKPLVLALRKARLIPQGNAAVKKAGLQIAISLFSLFLLGAFVVLFLVLAKII